LGFRRVADTDELPHLIGCQNFTRLAQGKEDALAVVGFLDGDREGRLPHLWDGLRLSSLHLCRFLVDAVDTGVVDKDLRLAKKKEQPFFVDLRQSFSKLLFKLRTTRIDPFLAFRISQYTPEDRDVEGRSPPRTPSAEYRSGR